MVSVLFSRVLCTNDQTRIWHRAGYLGASSWQHDRLGELTAISATRFSGTFVLFDVPMSYARYWVTVALDSISPEQDVDDDND
jgi:hypothetical protein